MRNVGVLCLAATLTASAAAAVPVNFAHELIKGTVETFDDLAPGVGDGNGPIFYDGFSVTTDIAHWALVSDDPPCHGNQCLQMYPSPVYSPIIGTPVPPPTAIFTDFPEGTRSFGLRLPGPHEGFSGRVVGVSGITEILGFTLPDEPQPEGLTLAYYDHAGLLGFEIASPLAYDDIVTSTAAIPLPPAGVLLLLALGGLGLAGRAGRRA